MRVEVRIPTFAVATVLASVSWSAAAEAMTLEEAIARALQKNGNVIVEREALSAARAAEGGAKGVYDPVVHFEGAWLRTTEPVNSSFSGAPPGELAPTTAGLDFDASISEALPTGGTVSLRAVASRLTSDGTFALYSPAYPARVGIELRQPLLALLPSSTTTPSFRVRVAALDRDRAGASLRRELADTAAAVERTYWTVGAVRRAVAVGEEAVRLAEEQMEMTVARIEMGAAAEAERAQPRAEVERRRGELLEGRELLSRAENALKVLILGDDDTELWKAPLLTNDDDALETVSADVGAWMERGLKARPEIEAATAVVERRRLEASLAHDLKRPTLDLVLGYDRYGLAGTPNPVVAPPPGTPGVEPVAARSGLGGAFGSLTDGGFSGARVGVVFNHAIGNRTARANAAVATATLRQAEAELAQARNAVRADVLDASAALQTAEARIAAARAGREAAETQLQAERERFAVGLSTNFLVLTRQNDLSRARLAEIESVHDYRNARTGVARATGTLLEERRITVEER